MRTTESTPGPCFWLTILATMTAFTWLLDRSGVPVPGAFIYICNPVAWVCNRIGLCAYFGGFLTGTDEAIENIASIIHWPVIGSFLLLMALGCIPWRRPGLMFFVLCVPQMCAMQLTTRRAYATLADYFHEHQRGGLEARSRSKVQLITDSCGIALPMSNEAKGSAGAGDDGGTSPLSPK